MGSKKVHVEQYAKESADNLMKNLNYGGAVDEFLQDQLIIFMALAEGESKILTGPIEMHTETSIHYATLMAGAKFNVEKRPDNTNIITCQGIGFENKYL